MGRAVSVSAPAMVNAFVRKILLILVECLSAQRIAHAQLVGAILLRRKQDRVAMVAAATCPFALLSALAVVVVVLCPSKIR